MGLKIGIVGLPNVGKSTLFNALVKGSKAQAENYPFCTTLPNVGIVEVPDERLAPLAEVSKSKKIVPTVVEFVDIAGLVRGASKGEGLGNQFLSHIRECDAIAMVVRFFEDENVIRYEGQPTADHPQGDKINPKDDIATIETELQLADIATVEKRQYNLDRDIKGGSKNAKMEKEALDKIIKKLCDGKNAREADLSNDELPLVKSLALMTMKPILYVANCDEKQLQAESFKLQVKKLTANSSKLEANFIPISAKIESELNELSDAEKKEYLESLGIEDSGINRLIKAAYKALNLITYFTSGEPETRAWTVRAGACAPEAAGVIHSDFEHGFIAAEVVPWQDLYAQGGWSGARTHGLVRTEGKNYIVRDGDVCLFRFNV